MSVNLTTLAEKLSKLNSTQQSIETLSQWCIFYKKVSTCHFHRHAGLALYAFSYLSCSHPYQGSDQAWNQPKHPWPSIGSLIRMILCEEILPIINGTTTVFSVLSKGDQRYVLEILSIIAAFVVLKMRAFTTPFLTKLECDMWTAGESTFPWSFWTTF